MADPIRHHFLPIAAYLRFFTMEARPDSLFLYRRGEDTKIVGIRDVGVEKSLYSLETQPGQFTNELEMVATATVDARAVELMGEAEFISTFR